MQKAKRSSASVVIVGLSQAQQSRANNYQNFFHVLFAITVNVKIATNQRKPHQDSTKLESGDDLKGNRKELYLRNQRLYWDKVAAATAAGTGITRTRLL